MSLSKFFIKCFSKIIAVFFVFYFLFNFLNLSSISTLSYAYAQSNETITKNQWTTGFVTNLSFESLFFAKSNTRNSQKVGAGIDFSTSYELSNLSVTGGFTYYLNNFYNNDALLMHFGLAYQGRFAISTNSFIHLGLGAALARDFLNDGVNFNLVPKVNMDFSINSFILGIYSKIYLPAQKQPELSYAAGLKLGFKF